MVLFLPELSNRAATKGGILQAHSHGSYRSENSGGSGSFLLVIGLVACVAVLAVLSIHAFGQLKQVTAQRDNAASTNQDLTLEIGRLTKQVYERDEQYGALLVKYQTDARPFSYGLNDLDVQRIKRALSDVLGDNACIAQPQFGR